MSKKYTTILLFEFKEIFRFHLILIFSLLIFFNYNSIVYSYEYTGETITINSPEDFNDIKQRPIGENKVNSNNFLLYNLYINDYLTNNKLSIKDGDKLDFYEFYYMKKIGISPFSGSITENELNINNVNANELYNISLTAGNKGNIVSNSTNITGGTINQLYNVRIGNSNEGDITDNILNMACGDLTNNSASKDIYNHNIYIEKNNTGNISGNITNLTDGNIDRHFHNIRISENKGKIFNNHINMNNGELKGKLYNVYIPSKNTDDIYNNTLNITKGNLKDNIINVSLRSTSGLIYNNIVNITDGSLSGSTYNVYIYNSENNSSDIYGNIVNVTGGNLESSVTNISTDVNSGNITGNIYNNSINITGGEFKGDKIININLKSEENINLYSNSIFIAGNVNIMGDIFMARNKDSKSSIPTSTNSTTFIATDLSHMTDYGRGIYTGSSANNNSIYFLGDKTTLLDNRIIKDDTNVVLANVNRAPTNTGVTLGKTNINIGDSINYTNNHNNILFDGDIILHLSLSTLKNSNNDSNNGNSLVMTSGKIGVLDTTSFSSGGKVSIELFDNESSITSLTEGEKYLLFKATGGIEDTLLDEYFDVASNSAIKNFEVIIDRDINGIYLSYIEPEEDKDNGDNNTGGDTPPTDPSNPTNPDNNKINNYLELAMFSTTKSLYRTSKNNFTHLSNKINNRLNNLQDNNIGYSDGYDKYNEYYNEYGTWTEMYVGNIKDKNNFDSDYIGLVFGREFINNDTIILGGTLNYNYNKIETDYRNIYSNSIGLSTYMRYNLSLFDKDIFFLDGILSYMYNSSREKSNTNNIDFTSLNINDDVIFKSKITSNQIFTDVGLGINFKYFEPKIGFNYSFISVDPYEDNYGNSIDRNKYNSLTAFTALSIKNFADVKLKTMTIKPRLFVRYDYDINEADMKITGRLNNNISASKYKLDYGEISEELLQYGISVDIKIINNFNLSIGYEGSRDKDNKYINNEIGIMGSVGW